MTTHCANPACAVPLHYLRDGRLFQFEVKPTVTGNPTIERNQEVSAVRRIARTVSHFWLCGRCASRLTLVFDAIKGVMVQPQKPLEMRNPS